MAGTGYQLAQVNIAVLREPLDSPALAGFVAALAPINALADESPGFVWRLQTEDGDATAIRPFDDERIIVNMSVWESPEALHDYVYGGRHRDALRRRREWFSRMGEAYVVLWWVPAGHRPSVAEGVERLEELRRSGPTARAFTLRTLFPPPNQVDGSPVDLPDACPAT